MKQIIYNNILIILIGWNAHILDVTKLSFGTLLTKYFHFHNVEFACSVYMKVRYVIAGVGCISFHTIYIINLAIMIKILAYRMANSMNIYS